VEERRCPECYIESDLNAEMVVEWTNPLNMKDTLAIIRYLYVEGSHEPSTVQHFYILITKIIVLHLQGIVHGDLRFANVVFGLNQSTLLDYDYSGKNRTYPPNFNLVIIIFLISYHY
jgi:tRNA A-37 threonylcarbamoyl transferase component Bud32